MPDAPIKRMERAHRLSSPVTISELQVVIHSQRRIGEDVGWIAFDSWVNQRVATLRNLFPNEHITSLPMSILFEESF